MRVRQAVIDDVLAIQGLNRELDGFHGDLWPGVFGRLEGDARGDSVILDWINGADSDYLVAEEDGRVVGFLSIRKAARPGYAMFRPGDFAMIEDVVVAASCRGSGVGTRLFEAAVGWARERGLGAVQTMVWSANEGAREFYLGRGNRIWPLIFG